MIGSINGRQFSFSRTLPEIVKESFRPFSRFLGKEYVYFSLQWFNISIVSPQCRSINRPHPISYRIYHNSEDAFLVLTSTSVDLEREQRPPRRISAINRHGHLYGIGRPGYHGRIGAHIDLAEPRIKAALPPFSPPFLLPNSVL